jgi:diguanylate cyclase (GGDEF)-like protein
MQNTKTEKAKQIADSIRKDISELEMLGISGSDSGQITASQGIASFPEDAKTLTGLRSKADKALYRAKEEGRNRVICA